MDKNRIKSFAIWARRSLIKSISEKAYSIGIYEDKILEATAVQGGFKLEGKEEIFTLSKKDRDALVKQVNEKGFEQVIEEVAYTWFNRFMGLRYMEVNDYLPTGVRILSSEVEGKKEPDVLTKVSEIIDELNLNANEIYDLLDTGNTLDREKAYRIILVKQCNELGKIIPQMFEKISDYTEVLLPDNLLEEGSVIRRMVEDIEESDWLEEVEIVGWMYQYYIAEEKERVIQAKKRYKKNEIPFATQLFTPKWIVKYMVENSLGRYLVENDKELEVLKDNWEFYINNNMSINDIEQCNINIEEIKILDPAMGSGHILVYAFDLLYEVYLKLGYRDREISRLILEKNLYGLDIDDRAIQLASFALIMKARHYNRRIFRGLQKEPLKLNVFSIKESNFINQEHFDILQKVGECEEIIRLVDIYKDAKIYGSLINVEKFTLSLEKIEKSLEEIENNDSFTLLELKQRDDLLNIIPLLLNQYRVMKNEYDILITNPPYMGSNYMTDKLSDFIKNDYNDVKSDLFSAFIKYSISKVKENGHLGFISPFVWMFLSSYKLLRENIINNTTISSLIQLEYNAFPEACVPVCTFTLRNTSSNLIGDYIKLSDFPGVEIQELKVKEAIINPKVKYRYVNHMGNYNKIPNNPIAFWMSENFINLFDSDKKLKDIGQLKSGSSTSGQNDKLFRFWFEVDNNKIEKKAKHYKEVTKRWILMNKGGAYRRWFGNLEYVCDNSFCPKNETEFNKAITWSDINSHYFSARVHQEGVIANNVGKRVYVENINYNHVLGFLNTKIAEEMLNLIIPTLHFDVGYVGNLPIIELSKEDKVIINDMVERNIKISKNEWDRYERSLDFKINPLLKKNNDNIINAFNDYIQISNYEFNELKENEERINKKFLEIYGLENELTYEIKDQDVTYRIGDNQSIIKEFISYAIGCMFGRYSINVEGVIYAGGDFLNIWNLNNGMVRNIERDESGNSTLGSWINTTFVPDFDNVIPITEDEYFEDDIVSRFIEFVRTAYGNETLEENLDFIADSIGRKSSETSRQAIRRYFIKEFYKDHLKIYQKRPIYWMFESGKNNGFKCLVYMHRYNEQTVAKVRTDYLHTLQRKYEAEINRLQLVVDSEEYTSKDRIAAKKKIDRISKQIEECREYDQVVAHLANEKISIDLDDGVKVNYAKFQDVKVINSKGKEIKMNLLAKI